MGKGGLEEERVTPETCLAGGECLRSTFQDGLGLPVQQGLTAPQNKKCLKPDAWQPAQRRNTVPGGAAAPALDTRTPHGARGRSLAKPLRGRPVREREVLKVFT